MFCFPISDSQRKTKNITSNGFYIYQLSILIFRLKLVLFKVITGNTSARQCDCYSNLTGLVGQNSSWFLINSLISRLVAVVSRFTQLQLLCAITSAFMTSVPGGVRPLARVRLSVEPFVVADHRLHHGAC